WLFCISYYSPSTPAGFSVCSGSPARSPVSQCAQHPARVPPSNQHPPAPRAMQSSRDRRVTGCAKHATNCHPRRITPVATAPRSVTARFGQRLWRPHRDALARPLLYAYQALTRVLPY
ncbi:hypothetical protein, partial [Pseudomonas sp. FEN]